MKKVLITLSFLMVLGIQVMLAQSRTISGTVTDATDGSKIPGAKVIVKGNPAKGAITTENGTYTLTVPQNAQTLVFSFIGMKSQEVAIGNRSKIDVALKADEAALEEVIVVGYGTSRKEANTGSLGVVKDKQIQSLPEVSFDKMLSGKIAGVMVTGASGQPGAATQVRIRGTSSLNAGNDPLYVVDGIPLMSVTQGKDDIFTNSSDPLAAINPNDIESITVLKDAAAASIYGSRAANGVILVTTKSGKTGKSVVKLRATNGITALANDNNFHVMNGNQLVQYMRDAVTNAGYDPDDPTAGNGSYYVPKSLTALPQNDWMRSVTRNGGIQEYEMSVSGGNEKTKQFTSLLYSDTKGVFYGVDYKKYQMRSNLEHKINDKMSIGTKINLYNSISKDVPMRMTNAKKPIQNNGPSISKTG